MKRSGHFKMVLLGSTHVGKSSLALRFVRGQYRDYSESTIGAAFLTQTLHLDDDLTLKIDVWDTAGQERYKSLAPMYYRDATAALIVYDITEYDSFRQAKLWVKELRQNNGNDTIIGLAGNKADLAIGNKERQVNTQEVAEYAEENGFVFMETSAKRDENVTEIFVKIARQVVLKKPNIIIGKPKEIFTSKELKSSENSCCAGKKENASK